MQDLILWAIGTIISLGAALTGWIFKMVFSAIKEVEINNSSLNSSLNDHKVYAAQTFATKKEVTDGFDRIMHKLDKIDDKLDSKVDKA
jgi:hypothetical protein